MAGIIVDTREKDPWTFTGRAHTQTQTLKIGDYRSERGYVVIERKNVDDFPATLQSERWRGQMLGMATLLKNGNVRVAAVIVEASLDHYRDQPIWPIVVNAVAQLHRWGLPINFAGSREAAEDLAFRLIREDRR